MHIEDSDSRSSAQGGIAMNRAASHALRNALAVKTKNPKAVQMTLES